jgi:mono/diheme cytochrome c family protein
MPDFRLDRLVRAPDGELFNTITNGKGRMSGYGRQIPAEDRWAIVTWLRVLQTMEVSK